MPARGTKPVLPGVPLGPLGGVPALGVCGAGPSLGGVLFVHEPSLFLMASGSAQGTLVVGTQHLGVNGEIWQEMELAAIASVSFDAQLALHVPPVPHAPANACGA